MRKFSVTLSNGDTYCVHQTTNDFWGNPRFVVHYLDIADSYEEALVRAKAYGGKKYKAKHFGGGVVFTTYDLIHLLNRMMGLTNK